MNWFRLFGYLLALTETVLENIEREMQNLSSPLYSWTDELHHDGCGTFSSGSVIVC